jgi:hypothetical protein
MLPLVLFRHGWKWLTKPSVCTIQISGLRGAFSEGTCSGFNCEHGELLVSLLCDTS